jgi:hypothetical protein
MIRGIKLVHIFGLVIFLGSILTFTVISILLEEASLKNFAFGRKIISTGTNFLTIPGLWVLAITGVWMGYIKYGLKQRFFKLKFLLITLIIMNAHFFVLPAVNSATELAKSSLAQGGLLPEYKTAYMQESIFGGVYILLTLVASVIGMWKIGGKSKYEDNIIC